MIWRGMVIQWFWMIVIPFVSMVVFCVCLWVQVLVTGMWIMRYAILGFFSCLLFPLSFLVSRSSKKRRLGILILVLVLIIFLGDYSLFSLLMTDFIIFQSVTGASECSSIAREAREVPDILSWWFLLTSVLNITFHAPRPWSPLQPLRQLHCEQNRHRGLNLHLIGADMIARGYLPSNLGMPILHIPFKAMGCNLGR